MTLLAGCADDAGRADGPAAAGEGGGKSDDLESTGEEPALCDLEQLQTIQDEGGDPQAIDCGPFTIHFFDDVGSLAGYDTWVIVADLDQVELVVSSPVQPTTSTATFADEQGLFVAINGNMFGCYADGGSYVPASPLQYPERCPEATRGEVGSEGPLAYRQFPMGVHCSDGTCFDNSWENQEGVDTQRHTHILVREDAVGQLVTVQPPGGEEVPLGCSAQDEQWPLGTGCDVNDAVSGLVRLVAEGQVADSGVNGELTQNDIGFLTGSIPFLGVSEDGQRIYLGVSRSGALRAARLLVDHFGPEAIGERPLHEAVMFDSGGSPSMWLGDSLFYTTDTGDDLLVPVRVGLRAR